jgi:hypothetical protein
MRGFVSWFLDDLLVIARLESDQATFSVFTGVPPEDFMVIWSALLITRSRDTVYFLGRAAEPSGIVWTWVSEDDGAEWEVLDAGGGF